MKFPTLLSLAAAPIALLCTAPALADDHVEAEEVEAADEAPAGPALWRVADEDTTIYLFGTVHMLPDTIDWNSGVVNDALASSETLVTELDMTPEVEAEIGKMFQDRGMLPEGQTLRALMTDEQRKTYEEGLAKIKVAPETFDTMEPWLASIVLLQIVSQASGFTPDKGVENVLEAAIGPDVGREALESVETQVLVFDELPVEQQVIYLLEFAADPVEGIKSLDVLVDEWAAGDAETVGTMMTEAMVGHPELAERLFYSRNRDWAEWIDTRLDSPGTVFMAVGAGHLAGEKSVQDFLTERGIETTRVQ